MIMGGAYSRPDWDTLNHSALAPGLRLPEKSDGAEKSKQMMRAWLQRAWDVSVVAPYRKEAAAAHDRHELDEAKYHADYAVRVILEKVRRDVTHIQADAFLKENETFMSNWVLQHYNDNITRFPPKEKMKAHTTSRAASKFYCVRCRQSTTGRDVRRAQTRKGQPMLKGKCARCGTGVNRFIKKSQ